MTDLPKGIREELGNYFSFPVLSPETIQKSSDGTVKTGFRLDDGNLTEAVLIPSGDRNTACISSQSGCPLACAFCATGGLGFFRNLTAGEIFDQVAYLIRLSGNNTGSHSLSNLVFMGMGEPLLNYDHVKRAIEKITSEDGLGISPQRITLSTVGISDMIIKMTDDKPKFQVALSLHTANNDKRNRIVPVNKKYPVESLTEAMKYYHKVRQKRFTIEYVLFGGFNDSTEDARELAQFCKSFPVKINLISYNAVPGTQFRRPEPHKVQKFSEFLESKNLVVNVRKNRGTDIDAACGQLAARYLIEDQNKQTGL
jgi:23S rRNA (adenine2503-C2)-methyltransferase